MKRQQLTKEDWLAAGFLALSRDGPSAIKAEALARALKSTKGSFYWHFADVPRFKQAMLTLWKEKVASEVIEEVTLQSDPLQRVATLVARASDPAPEEFGGRKIEPAMRAWALSDPEVARALADIDETRIGFIRTLLTDLNLQAPNLAELIYGAYIGLDDLASKDRADITKSLERLFALLGQEV